MKYDLLRLDVDMARLVIKQVVFTDACDPLRWVSCEEICPHRSVPTETADQAPCALSLDTHINTHDSSVALQVESTIFNATHSKQ